MEHKYALPSLTVVDEVRPCVLVPILPRCDPSRVLVNSLIPITSVPPPLMVENAALMCANRQGCGGDEEDGERSAANNSSGPNPLDIALNASLEHHQRTILSQAATHQGLGTRHSNAGGGKGMRQRTRHAGRKRGVRSVEGADCADGQASPDDDVDTSEQQRGGGDGDTLDDRMAEASAHRFFTSDTRARGEQCHDEHAMPRPCAASPFADVLRSPPYAPAAPLAMVEWVTGDVSCTHDTDGLGEEERLRLRYTLNLRRDPLIPRLGGGGGDALAAPPLHRENAPMDIAKEQLMRIAHCGLVRRHQSVDYARNTPIGGATRALHSTLPPAYYNALFPASPSASPAYNPFLAHDADIGTAVEFMDAMASALMNNHDSVQSCRMTKQMVPPASAYRGGPSGGSSDKKAGGAPRSLEEDHDERLLLCAGASKSRSKAVVTDGKSSVKAVIVSSLKKSAVGRRFIEERTAAHGISSRAGNTNDAIANGRGDEDALAAALFSPTQLAIMNTFDVIFYHHDKSDPSMALYAFTVGHMLRPYGHRTLPFRLLPALLEGQVGDVMGLLLSFIDRCVCGKGNGDDASSAVVVELLTAADIVTVVSATINSAASLLRAHIGRLSQTIRFALLGYAAEAAHRYVVVAVRNRMQKQRKEGLSLEVTEALDYLYYRVPHSQLAEGAIQRLLLSPSAADDGELLPPPFWVAFAAEEERMMGRQCAHIAAAAVAQCQKEVRKMGRTHTWEEVNSAFYLKER